MVVRNGIWLAGAGRGLGIGRFRRSNPHRGLWLYGISALDPLTYAAVSFGALAAAATVSYLPHVARPR